MRLATRRWTFLSRSPTRESATSRASFSYASWRVMPAARASLDRALPWPRCALPRWCFSWELARLYNLYQSVGGGWLTVGFVGGGKGRYEGWWADGMAEGGPGVERWKPAEGASVAAEGTESWERKRTITHTLRPHQAGRARYPGSKARVCHQAPRRSGRWSVVRGNKLANTRHEAFVETVRLWAHTAGMPVGASSGSGVLSRTRPVIARRPALRST